MRINVNTDIALTYLYSRKKQTIVAALGVTFGISMYIFMQSLMSGTNDYFEKMSFNSLPHIRLYNDYTTSGTDIMQRYYNDSTYKMLMNPQLVPQEINVRNPYHIIDVLKKDTDIVAMAPQVTDNIFYTAGNIQVGGQVIGTNVVEEDKMFDIQGTMITGRMEDLPATSNGILLGQGVADKLCLHVGDNITITGSNGTNKIMKVVGTFATTIAAVDKSRCYANISAVQQLLKKDPTYITDIYINIKNYHNAPAKARVIEKETGYTAEDWLTANAQMQAGFKVRAVILNATIAVILLVAGFGIYNILNMTIYEKIKEIAILKANGFSGTAVTSIFIQQALYIGVMGGIVGLGMGWVTAYWVSKIYIGAGTLKYLPMSFLAKHYIQGMLFGVLTTFFAGWFPARKAAKVDPVQIIRG